jgi:hypothetical protein
MRLFSATFPVVSAKFWLFWQNFEIGFNLGEVTPKTAIYQSVIGQSFFHSTAIAKPTRYKFPATKNQIFLQGYEAYNATIEEVCSEILEVRGLGWCTKQVSGLQIKNVWVNRFAMSRCGGHIWQYARSITSFGTVLM